MLDSASHETDIRAVVSWSTGVFTAHSAVIQPNVTDRQTIVRHNLTGRKVPSRIILFVVVFGGKRARLTSYLLTTSPGETGGESGLERPACTRTTHSQPQRGVDLQRLQSGPPL